MQNKLKFALLSVAFSSVLFIACEKTIDYNTADIPPNFTALAKPTTGAGYQIHMATFPIPANFEREIFLRLPVGNTEDVYVNSFEAKMRQGSHHLIAYGFPDESVKNLPTVGIMRDQNSPNGTINLNSSMPNTLFIFGAPTADFKQSLPDGYAIKLKKDATFDMNVHYFNKTDATRFGEVYMNVYTVPKEKVKKELISIAFFNYDVMIFEPNTTKVITQKFTYDAPVRVHQLTSHTHARGMRYEIHINGGKRDNELVYVSEDWEHPAIINFPTPIDLKAGEGLTSVVTYKNTTNRTIKDGVTSSDEMNIIYGYYEKM